MGLYTDYWENDAALCRLGNHSYTRTERDDRRLLNGEPPPPPPLPGQRRPMKKLCSSCEGCRSAAYSIQDTNPFSLLQSVQRPGLGLRV